MHDLGSTPAGVAIPGPVDRTSFFAEQERRRRHARWYSVLAGFCAAVLGIPFAMVVTPALYLTGALALRLLDIVIPVPDAAWSVFRAIGSLFEGAPAAVTAGPSARWVGLVLRAAALFLPGMAVTVLVWLWLRRLFAEASSFDVMLARVGARAPATADLEERQLVNVVEEMALAGGLTPLRVRVIDADTPNAAVFGADERQATVVVTRGLLDRIPRGETQAVVGHLVASAGNGDLRVLLSLMTLFQAIGLVFTAFEAVMNLSQGAWRDLRALVRWTLAPAGSRDAEAGAALTHLLDRNIDESRTDGVYGLLLELQSDTRSARRGRRRTLPMVALLALPLALVYMVVIVFVRFEVFLVRIAVVGPILMLACRSRRYRADATAVQLTRDPGALANALERLAVEGAVVPGGAWFSQYFIVGTEAAAERREIGRRNELAELRRTRSYWRAYRAAQRYGNENATTGKGTWAGERAGAAPHPRISRRLKRIAKMGARLRAQGLVGEWAAIRDDERRGAQSWGARVLGGVVALVLLPIVALVAYMMGVVMAMALGLATLFALVFMAGSLWILRLVVP